MEKQKNPPTPKPESWKQKLLWTLVKTALRGALHLAIPYLANWAHHLGPVAAVVQNLFG